MQVDVNSYRERFRATAEAIDHMGSLRGVTLESAITDLRALLDRHPDSAAVLRAATVEGRVDGSTTWNTAKECGCVLGWVGRAVGREPRHFANSERDGFGARTFLAAEYLAFAVSNGDTPETAEGARCLLAVVDDWMQANAPISGGHA